MIQGEETIFELGEVVEANPIESYVGSFIGKIIAISPWNLLLTRDDKTIYCWPLDRLVINNFMVDKTIQVLDEIESFEGKPVWFIGKSECRHVNANTIKSAGNICAKCGGIDEYASPSMKHNNEIRCYRCC